MFKTEVGDIKELYDALDSRSEREIGYLLIENSGPLGSIITLLAPHEKNYSLYSVLSAADNDYKGKIPNQKIEKSLHDLYSKKYLCENSSPEQMVIKSDKRVYILSKKKIYLDTLGMYDRLILETRQKRETAKTFKRALCEHNEILESVVESLYNRADVPDITYFLQVTLERGKKEYRERKGESPSSPDGEISLDKLEKLVEVEDPQITFGQIGGCQRGKEEMMMICEDIEHPEIARYFGRDPEDKKGILLYGDYGCGKTLLVKALATKLKKDLQGKVKFYAIHYKDVTSIFRGGEAIATGRIFDLVARNEKKKLKTILFIDELHVIAERRRDGFGPKDEALDTFLSQLDGMRKYKGLTVIGSTYQPIEMLDQALIRPGRFNTWIRIQKPNREERAEIFGIYVKQRQEWAARSGNMNLFVELDLQKIAEATEGFNGSDIVQVLEKAVRNRERQARLKAGREAPKERILEEFKPITTDFFLQMIEDYKEKRRKK